MPVDVLIVLGSKTDAEVGKQASSFLDQFGVGYDMVVASAHRTPDLLRDLIRNTTAKVFIAIAGLSAALPGTIAAHTTKPVIGVPVSGKLNLDAVLSVSQMPPGVPVAAVGLDRGENAAILAVEILALRDERLGEKLKEHREAKTFGADHLVQGTIAPDWIESGGQLRDRIKTHHNVGGLPENMKLKVVEPLRDLYKDEVRAVARALGVTVSERQPFPGPGLAVRVIGEVTPDRVDLVRGASAIVEEEVRAAAGRSLMPLPWEYFAVLLPVQTCGVHGDVRVYGHTVALRAVDSIDGMTALYSKIPHEVLDRISIRITNEVAGINRVAYDVSNKPPATIEWE